MKLVVIVFAALLTLFAMACMVCAIIIGALVFEKLNIDAWLDKKATKIAEKIRRRWGA